MYDSDKIILILTNIIKNICTKNLKHVIYHCYEDGTANIYSFDKQIIPQLIINTKNIRNILSNDEIAITQTTNKNNSTIHIKLKINTNVDINTIMGILRIHNILK